ncbi:MAG: hypothetical protein ACRD5Z_09515 [Bryobacteraceae bacterium]
MDPNHLHEDISVHLFTVSAGMVGVCLTVIGLIRVVITVGRVDTLADNLLAIDALLYVLCCFASYWALRTRQERRMRRLERVADSLFLLAMLLMTVICGFITFAIAVPR